MCIHMCARISNGRPLPKQSLPPRQRHSPVWLVKDWRRRWTRAPTILESSRSSNALGLESLHMVHICAMAHAQQSVAWRESKAFVPLKGSAVWYWHVALLCTAASGLPQPQQVPMR